MKKSTKAQLMALKIKLRIEELIEEQEVRAKEAAELGFKHRANGNYEEAGRKYFELSSALSEITGLRAASMVAWIQVCGKNGF